MPFVSVPTTKSMLGLTGTYLKVVMIVSLLVQCTAISFYFALYFPEADEYNIEKCSIIEKILRTLGVTDYAELSTENVVTWVLPEPIMVGTSSVFLFIFKQITQGGLIRGDDGVDASYIQYYEIKRKKRIKTVLTIGTYILTGLFCLTAILRPSVIGAVYFLMFLISTSYWGCYKTLGKFFARILSAILPIMFVHITLLYVYQFQFLQELDSIKPNTLIGRLLQLKRFKTMDSCADPSIFRVHEHSWGTYLFPFALVVLYYLSVLIARQNLQAKDGIGGLIFAMFQRDKLPAPSNKWRSAFQKVQLKIEEEKLLGFPGEEADHTWRDRFSEVFDHISTFIMKTSYLATNFVMMVWAICFVSWKNVILLIWANLIWLLPARKQIMLRSSPFILMYIWTLICINYVYALELSGEELPSYLSFINLSSGIDRNSSNKQSPLLIKCLCAVIICSTLRQFMQERSIKKQQQNLVEAVGVSEAAAITDLNENRPAKIIDKIETVIKQIFVICWIWVVGILLIFMCFWQKITPVLTTFFVFALLLILSFQLCPFNYWKKFLFFYWWLLIVYTIVNLFGIYIYQFSPIREFIHKNVVSKQTCNRVGLFIFDTKGLFFMLSIPVFFQISVVIQQNYLQNDFNRLTSPRPVQPEDKEKNQNDDSLWQSFLGQLKVFMELWWIILELHLPKVILFVGWCVCIFDICALFVPFVVLLMVSCLFGGCFTSFTIYLMSVYVSILSLLRIIYMHQYDGHSNWNYIGQYERKGIVYNITLNSAKWLGFQESKFGKIYVDADQLVWCMAYIGMVTLHRVVRVRQTNYRLSRNLSTKEAQVAFPDINFRNCHDSTSNMIKYLTNYGFYKFGIEITGVMSVILMFVRMDFMAIVAIIIVLLMVSMSRSVAFKVWLIIMIVMCLAVPFQYLLTLGFWPSLWDFSYTRFWNKYDFRIRVQHFLQMMNLAHPPDARKLIIDFLLVMCLSRQWRAFQIERKYRGREYDGGSNESISHLVDDVDIVNPVPDYIAYTRTYLDIYYRIFFTCFFYFTILATFLAGGMRPTIFSFGYILWSYILLWEGTDLFLRHPDSILFRWHTIIFYNVFIMAFRTIGEVFGCILVYESKYSDCRLYRLLCVGCCNKFGDMSNIPNLSTKTPCPVNEAGLGLFWDCMCYSFLIFQKRIFRSYYFFHIVNDTKAKTILANRGAALIEFLNHEKKVAADARDNTIRENMKKKLQMYKSNRQKIQGEAYYVRKKSHWDVLRSGDYYLFDEVVNNLNIDLVPPKVKYVDIEFDPTDPMKLSEYFGLLLQSNISTVLAERKRRQQKKKGQFGQSKANLKSSAPKPGTSTDDNIDTNISTGKKVLIFFTFVWGSFECTVVSLTALLYRSSREFRYILNEMNIDRQLLKLHTNYTQGIRSGPKRVWSPTETYEDFFKNTKRDTKESHLRLSIYAKFFRSVWFCLLSQSEWLCYALILYNQVRRANFISLPLVIMMFCWGCLTVPKPTKMYWVITITYASIMLLIKDFFELEIADFNTYMYYNNIFFPPTVIGIYRSVNRMVNLIVMSALFFHRLVLQWLGLWKPNEYRVVSLMKDGDYSIKDNKLIRQPDRNTPSTSTVNASKFTVYSMPVSMGDYFPRSIKHGYCHQKQVMEFECLETNPGLCPFFLLFYSMSCDDEVHESAHLFDAIITNYSKLITCSIGWSFSASLHRIGSLIMVIDLVFGIEMLLLYLFAVWLNSNSIRCRLSTLSAMRTASMEKYAEGFRQFFHQLLSPSYTQVPVDVYTPMFLCDLVNFFVLMFFYKYFQSTSEDMGFIQYIQNNRVPIDFIVGLLFQLGLMVVDRWIYLRKNRFAKLVFHFAQVFGVHIYFFVLYPMVTDRLFKFTIAAQVYYIFKCFYFLLSCYQIRKGYPSIISLHCMWHDFGLFNSCVHKFNLGTPCYFITLCISVINFGFAFRLYTSIPYLFLVRSLLDWTCVDTSLGVSDWFKMEDITKEIFDQKCESEFEKLRSAPAGRKKSRAPKYLIGGFLFIILLLIIIGPFLFFSLSSAVGTTTRPKSITFNLYIGSQEPVMHSNSLQDFYSEFGKEDLKNLTSTFNNMNASENVFTLFGPEDVIAANWPSHSLTQWIISPAILQTLIEKIKDPNKVITITTEFKYTHEGNGNTATEQTFGFAAEIPPLPNKNRQNLLNMIMNKSADPVVVPFVFPKFVRIEKESTATVLSLMEEVQSDLYELESTNPLAHKFRNLLIALHRKGSNIWWEVREECDPNDPNYRYYLQHLIYHSCDHLVMYIFNEKKFSETLSAVTANGILGMYLVYFMMIYGFIQGAIINISDIWIEELPNCDRILKKCFEVYIARDFENYELEEELFAELIFIMRSREIIIKLSRLEDDPYNPTFITPGTRRR